MVFANLIDGRAIARQLMADARQAITPLGNRANLLLAFCDYLENRAH